MKIYFAGSIRAGRNDVDIYQAFTACLEEYGKILTSHVADPNLTIEGEEGLSEEEIFDRDVEWMKEADVVVAEVSTPSLGVGYELAIASQMDKPILCLLKAEIKIFSAMIAGDRKIQVEKYHNIEEGIGKIQQFVKPLADV